MVYTVREVFDCLIRERYFDLVSADPRLEKAERIDSNLKRTMAYLDLSGTNFSSGRGTYIAMLENIYHREKGIELLTMHSEKPSDPILFGYSNKGGDRLMTRVKNRLSMGEINKDVFDRLSKIEFILKDNTGDFFCLNFDWNVTDPQKAKEVVATMMGLERRD